MNVSTNTPSGRTGAKHEFDCAPVTICVLSALIGSDNTFLMSEQRKPLISVVIPTRNAAHFLNACLKAIRAQDYPSNEVEIIVVDNFSTDDTPAIAAQHGIRFFQLGPERSAQRNFGAAQAQGEFLLFLDADMAISPTVLRECLAVMKNPEVAGCFISERIIGTGFWINVRNFERSFYDATPIDAVRFIRKSVFLETGGYDTNLCGPEDWDLDRRLAAKGKLAQAHTHLSHNEGEFQLLPYLRKKTYYAQNFSAYMTKWGRDDITQKQFGLWYRYFGVFLEQGKWKRFLAHPIYALAMYWLRFLVGVVYLRSDGWSKR